MHNSNRSSGVAFLSMLMSLLVVRQLAATTASFDVLVVDAETGLPISGVNVAGWFSNSNGWKAWTESAPESVDNKTTDKNGFCHVSGETNTGETGVNIRHPPSGYYPNCFCVRYTFTDKPKWPFMQWRPTNAVITAALHRVVNPIPLFVKKAGRKFDVDWPKEGDEGTNSVLRYDFIVGDWLPPDGKGLTADFTISAKMATSRHVDRWLRIDNSEGSRTTRFYMVSYEFTYCGEGNGIVRSDVPKSAISFVRNADVDNYVQSLFKVHGRRRKIVGPNVYYEDFSDTDKRLCYTFRIRSKFDKAGNLVEAYYGKIYGDICLHGNWKEGYNGISFLYYLNPSPNDTNLEWDMKNNLCPTPGDIGELRP